MSINIILHPSIQRIHDRYGKAKIDRARHLYFANVLPTDISESLEIDLDDLGYLCFGIDRRGTEPTSWYSEKQKRPSRSIQTYTTVKPYILKQTEMKMMELVNRSADHLLESDDDLDMDGISKAVGIIEKVDKITRLEEGKATENLEISTGFTLRDITNGKHIELDDEESIDAEFNPLNNTGDNE